MATIEMTAKRRALAIMSLNDSVSAIVEQLNHFVPTEQRLEVFELPLGVPKHGDTFINETEILDRVSTFLKSINTGLDGLLQSVDATNKLADELIELQAKLNEPSKPEVDSETKSDETEKTDSESEVDDSESDETDPNDEIFDETESQLDDDEKAEEPTQRQGKRGRPKKK